MIDFGDTDYHLDCFAFVGMIFGKDCQGEGFVQIMEIIDRELILGLADNHDTIRELKRELPEIKTANDIKPVTLDPNRLDVSKRLIPPVIKSFEDHEYRFWEKFGINKAVLDRFKVKSLARFNGISKTGNEYSIDCTESEPLFAYVGQRFIKVYRPFSNRRFYYAGDLKEGYCFGLKQLPVRGDILFITGGEKDVMSLSAKGFNAISFNSETSRIPKNLIRRLSFRFKHIVLLYDNDSTGLKAMSKQVEQLKEFEVKQLVLPPMQIEGRKDVSDFFELRNSADDIMKLFRVLLDKQYEETMSMLASCEINFDNPPESPEAVVTINDVPVGSAGNLLAITGSEGSGKSNFLGGLLAGTLGKPGVKIDTLGTEISQNDSGKAVLFYDTEQSEEQLYKNLKQITRRAQIDRPPNWFKTYGLVSMERKDRLTNILHSMDRFYYEYGGIHMVVIDGIADLVGAVNDEEQSVILVEELFRLAGIYKTCIVCVLHLSPSGYKLRGHLGSEVQRKAAGIISVEKDDEKQDSIIKALKVRDGSPLEVPQIVISWSDELKYHVYVGTKDQSSPKQRKIDDLTDIARHIFVDGKNKLYKEIILELQERLNVKERQSKNYLKFMREHHIIIPVEGESSSYQLKVAPL
jgi:muconolactone delta-isomerase